MADHARARGTFAKRVGANLARARRQVGISQEELGYRAGLHRTAVGQVERGERVARLDSALKLVLALGVPIGVLVEGIEWNSPQVASGAFSYAAGEEAQPSQEAANQKLSPANNKDQGNEAP